MPLFDLKPQSFCLCQKYLLNFYFRSIGKPITFTLPVGGLQGAKTAGGQQIISMPQKGLTIGGKAVTVQLAPGTGGQKTVTILSSAAGSGVQKTLTQADLPPGHKIVMIQPKRNDGSNVVTHKTISEPMNAYTTDMNLMDNNMDSGVGTEQQIEQMDGAHDNIGTTDAKETSESSNEHGSNSDEEEEVIGQIESGVVGLMKKKTVRKSKNIGVPHKHKPKFVKMGLFGGSPATPAANTTSTATAGNQGTSDIEHSEESTNPSQDESEFEVGNQESQNAQSSMLNDHQALPPSDVNEPLTGNSGDQSENQTNERFDNNEPTASETEAANILTIIKSGELLLSRNDETTPTSGAVTGQTNGDGNVTILFNNEPHTTKGSSVSASPVSSTTTKTIQKSVGFTSNTGHLDALASAALQASTNESNESAPTAGGGNEFNANEPTKQRGVIRHRRTTIESRDEVSLLHAIGYNGISLNSIISFRTNPLPMQDANGIQSEYSKD